MNSNAPAGRQGSTLVEVLVAFGILAIGYVAISTTCSTCMGIVKNQRETMAAAQNLQERMTQIQAAGWPQLTDATALSQGVMAVASPQADSLNQANETILVTTYPPVTPAASPLKVKRSGGVVTIVSAPPGGLSVRQIVAVRVDVHIDWKSGQRTRTRELSTIVALGGLLH